MAMVISMATVIKWVGGGAGDGGGAADDDDHDHGGGAGASEDCSKCHRPVANLYRGIAFRAVLAVLAAFRIL
jgi:hypothetical protein